MKARLRTFVQGGDRSFGTLLREVVDRWVSKD